jgi:nucleoside 2-deoxyribosyltransferase
MVPEDVFRMVIRWSTMRIYLACTVRGDRSGLEAARLIAQRLTALGHQILTSHLLADDVDEAEASFGDREVFERDLWWLDASDVLIAEASGSTYGVGFEVGYIVGRAPHSCQLTCRCTSSAVTAGSST